ncbi:hypothetical protein HZS_1475 [Henneguya salminicola]|nr:hypothetical protein HZS_1475 [Henneguya salminicola]
MGDKILLPALDIIKQLVIFEVFFSEFFIDRKNCYSFDLIEFLKNFTQDHIQPKCQMLAIRVYCNCFIHTQYHIILLQNLLQINELIMSYSLWSDSNTQLSLSSLIFNFSILLHSPLFNETTELINFFRNTIWILDAFGNILSDETVICLLSSICNTLCVPNKTILKNESFITLIKFLDQTKNQSPKFVPIKSYLLTKLNNIN